MPELELANVSPDAQPEFDDVPDTLALRATAPPPAVAAPTSVPIPTAQVPAPRVPAARPRRPDAERAAQAADEDAAEADAPAPAPRRRATPSIPAGTTITVASAARVCSNTAKVGTRFTASVQEHVEGADGATIPAGSAVTLEVTGVDGGKLDLAATSVDVNGAEYEVSGTATAERLEPVRAASRKKDLLKVLGGVALGAAAGQAAGKNTKSTIIGAAAGAAAGTAAAAATGGTAVCVPSGGRITFDLGTPLRLATR